MRISEIYTSRQGEGLLTGQDSIFLRTSGCNLRCHFCDTPYTSWRPEGRRMELPAVIEQVESLEGDHVVITGGEPMLPRGIIPLTRQLTSRGYHVTIETAGTLFRPVACDLMSISPKMSNSTPTTEDAGLWSGRHEKTRSRPEIVQRMIGMYPYQLKFVVVDPPDVEEIVDFCGRLQGLDARRVLLMPEGTDRATLNRREPWIRQVCRQHGFTFCPRMHIHWYGNRRGT